MARVKAKFRAFPSLGVAMRRRDFITLTRLRRSYGAAHGERAATGTDTAAFRLNGDRRERFGLVGTGRRVRAWVGEARLDTRPQSSDRLSMGCG